MVDLRAEVSQTKQTNINSCWNVTCMFLFACILIKFIPNLLYLSFAFSSAFSNLTWLYSCCFYTPNYRVVRFGFSFFFCKLLFMTNCTCSESHSILFTHCVFIFCYNTHDVRVQDYTKQSIKFIFIVHILLLKICSILWQLLQFVHLYEMCVLSL